MSTTDDAVCVFQPLRFVVVVVGDIAELLIYLLRHYGVPSTYAQGTGRAPCVVLISNSQQSLHQVSLSPHLCALVVRLA